MYADLLIYNGKGLSFSQEISTFDWIAIKKDQILAMGRADTYTSALSGWEETINAEGGSILPGFYDSSVHLMQTAFHEDRLCLRHASSFEEIGEMIKAEAAKGGDRPIFGYGLDELKLKEGRLPDRHVLDSYCKDLPVWLSRVEYHTSVLNTHALLYYKIPYTLDGIELDQRKVPTGIIRLGANAKLREDILTDVSISNRMSAVSKTCAAFLQQGITTVNAMEGGFTFSDRDAEFVYMYQDALPIDVVLFYQTTDVEKIREMKLSRMGGSLFADGAFGSRNAALQEDYADRPGCRGNLYYTQEEMNDLVLSCYQRDIQLAVHAIGERAIDQVISAHQYAFSQTGKTGLRHRLEHAELISAKSMDKAQELGLILSMQPAYEHYWGGPGKMYEKRLGERYLYTNPFREIQEKGLLICGGSDSDVTPASPILGIHMAVNHPIARHRLDILSAIRMFTINGAYAVFEEKEKGHLAPGCLADVVILDRDILAVDSTEICDCQVVYTLKSGIIGFAARALT